MENGIGMRTMQGEEKMEAEGGPSPQRPVFTTQQLFGSAAEIEILHQGVAYRLRITRQGKLILNK